MRFRLVTMRIRQTRSPLEKFPWPNQSSSGLPSNQPPTEHAKGTCNHSFLLCQSGHNDLSASCGIGNTPQAVVDGLPSLRWSSSQLSVCSTKIQSAHGLLRYFHQLLAHTWDLLASEKSVFLPVDEAMNDQWLDRQFFHVQRNHWQGWTTYTISTKELQEQ